MADATKMGLEATNAAASCSTGGFESQEGAFISCAGIQDDRRKLEMAASMHEIPQSEAILCVFSTEIVVANDSSLPRPPTSSHFAVLQPQLHSQFAS